MPTVRLLQPVAGLDFSWVPGDEIDLPDEEAAKWADGIRGELVSPEVVVVPEVVVETPEEVVAPIETPEAVVEAPETPEANAEQPTRRGPGRPRKS